MIVIPNTSRKAIDEFFLNRKDVVYRYVTTQIQKNMSTDIKRIDLFTFENTGIITAVLRSDFRKVLTGALSHFIEVEDYKYAELCKKLLDKLSVREFLNDVDSTE